MTIFPWNVLIHFRLLPSVPLPLSLTSASVLPWTPLPLPANPSQTCTLTHLSLAPPQLCSNPSATPVSVFPGCLNLCSHPSGSEASPLPISYITCFSVHHTSAKLLFPQQDSLHFSLAQNLSMILNVCCLQGTSQAFLAIDSKGDLPYDMGDLPSKPPASWVLCCQTPS